MGLKHSYQWIDESILLSTWEGALTKEVLRDVTHSRIELTQDRTEPYVLVLDMRNATYKLLDVQFNKWAFHVDPKMYGVVVVTKTDMAEATVGTLVRLMSDNLTLTSDFEAGLEVARNLIRDMEPA